MKTMNPIAAPAPATSSSILVGDAQPVEFGEAAVLLE
jgi:acetyl-CoA carboxylase biotin carboxyl carrier protein